MASASRTAASAACVRLAGGEQRRQVVVEFAAGADPARGVEARQQRVQALLFELPLDALRDRAAEEVGSLVCLGQRLGNRRQRLGATP
jgi:hypothetical protein